MRSFVYAALAASLAVSLPANPVRSDVHRTHPTPGLEGYTVPFWPDATYRQDVRTPDAVIGFALGAKPATHGDVLRYFEYLDTTFHNATLVEYARTYEGRACVYLLISSEGNASRLKDIQADNLKLADPRGLSAADANRIVDRAPAIAWLAYGIHGDELSSCDAALQLAYQLIAGTDAQTKHILDNVVVAIDPMENPDGRSRWISMLEQYHSVMPNYDIQSLHHRGVWPYGRTNHYLFDLNRDWFATVHPETRGKTAAILDWMPQYLLDAHEMGPTSTYLFSPPREPFNPYMVSYIHKWWAKVAQDQGAAFDRYGWAYYTREWNEEFFPGYGSSWAIYLGAIGMLFEQAGVDGSAVKRPEGTIMAYRETVHHQFVGSMANLLTVANGRKELLQDFLQLKVDNVRSRGGTFVLTPGEDQTRFERLIEKIQHQHIEVERTTEAFTLSQAQSMWGTPAKNVRVPAGAAIVRTNQPLRQLIEAILTFDIRIPTSFLETEKKEILKNRSSKLYDTTGWSMALAYGVESYFADSAVRVATEPYEISAPIGGVDSHDTSVGYVFDGNDERALHLVSRLMSAGVRVRSAHKPFVVSGREYPRGSFQIRISDNPELDANFVSTQAEECGIEVTGIDSGLGAGRFADLGGDEFQLLQMPRIALVGGNPVAFYNFGAIWHLLDSRFQIRTTTLDVSSLGNVDLNVYNVVVLPHNWGGPANYKQILGDAGVRRLRDWVRDGGTLIAEGNASAFLADSSTAISSVRLRRQSLRKLAFYEDALAAAREAESPAIDSLSIWDAAVKAAAESEEKKEKATPKQEQIEQADEMARRLFPRGAILRAELDNEHWMTVGLGPAVPVMFNTDYAYLSSGSVQIPARLARAGQLRMSGLLWDEARERWAETVYASRESSGRGQVILFATLPNFRGYFHGAERMLLNAMILGPGMGTRPSMPW